MTREVLYDEPDGTVVAYDETPEEREQRIAARNERVSKLVRMTDGQLAVLVRAQAKRSPRQPS